MKVFLVSRRKPHIKFFGEVFDGGDVMVLGESEVYKKLLMR